MDKTTAYLFVLAVSCVFDMPLVKAIRTLLVLRERIIIPILRIRTEGHRTTSMIFSRHADTMDCSRCRTSFSRYVITNPQY